MNKNVAKLRRALIGASLLLLLTGVVAAQDTVFDIRNGTILSVNGNELVVRGPQGTRAFQVPDDFVFNMDDKQLTIKDLKPGMPISAVIKTTETPIQMTETEVKEGKVLHTIGSAFVVKMSDGQTKKFSSKNIEAQHLIIYKNGKPISPYDLKKGDNISATIITEAAPQVLTESELAVFVQQAPQPKPVVIAQAAPKPAPAPPPPPPKPAALPKTGSRLPWVAFAGLISLAAGVGLTIRRFLFAG